MSFYPSSKSDLSAPLMHWLIDPTGFATTAVGDASKTTDGDAATQYGNINDWDVSRVTDMSELFRHGRTSSLGGTIITTSFNTDISSWDVSSVEDMSSMFYGCISFNKDLSGWDVSSVENMQSMFYNNYAFNQDLSGWERQKWSKWSNEYFHISKCNRYESYVLLCPRLQPTYW